MPAETKDHLVIAHPDVSCVGSAEWTRPRLAELLQALIYRHGDRPLVGQRARVPRIDPRTGWTTATLTDRFATASGGELWARVRAVAAALHRGAGPPVRRADAVVTIAPPGIDGLVIDMVCAHLGLVSVPLPPDVPAESIAEILTRTRPSVVAVTVDRLDVTCGAMTTTDLPSRLIALDYRLQLSGHREIVDRANRRLGASPILLTGLDELADRGCRLPSAPLFTHGDGGRPAMVSYRGGSSQSVVVTEETLSRLWSKALLPHDGWPVDSLTYIPLDHPGGRLPLVSALRSGGTTHFGTGTDTASLVDDLAILRPTELGLVPAVVDRLFHHHRTVMDRFVAAGADAETAQRRADRYLRDDVVGGRVIDAWVSAPLSGGLQHFIDRVLGIRVVAVSR
ncbi:AMP-binding protein [Mycolicibacterium litorale]|uniref:AMP-binding protein n=1 Tax=Mycolicibacterium litorale TaxID=758802 RepID=UPI0016297B3E|nr:AMP-binding protein [Mycolicibacterium litorale]